MPRAQLNPARRPAHGAQVTSSERQEDLSRLFLLPVLLNDSPAPYSRVKCVGARVRQADDGYLGVRFGWAEEPTSYQGGALIHLSPRKAPARRVFITPLQDSDTFFTEHWSVARWPAESGYRERGWVAILEMDIVLTGPERHAVSAAASETSALIRGQLYIGEHGLPVMEPGANRAALVAGLPMHRLLSRFLPVVIGADQEVIAESARTFAEAYEVPVALELWGTGLIPARG